MSKRLETLKSLCEEAGLDFDELDTDWQESERYVTAAWSCGCMVVDGSDNLEVATQMLSDCIFEAVANGERQVFEKGYHAFDLDLGVELDVKLKVVIEPAEVHA